MNSTKLLLIGAAVALGSGTALVQAQTNAPATAATPATPAAPATSSDLAASGANPAAKGVPAQPVDPLAPAAETPADKSAAASPETQTKVLKGKSRKKRN